MKKTFFILALALMGIFLFSCGGYIKRGGMVYLGYANLEVGSGKQWVRGSDYKTFKSLKAGGFNLGKDNSHVFCETQILKNADPATFQKISKYYWKDKNQVYYFGMQESTDGDNPTSTYTIPGADPSSFFIYKKVPWSRDKNTVFHMHHSLEVDNANNFIPIDEDWGKDSSHYFFWNNRVDSADYSSFVLLGDSYARDKYHVYFMHEIVAGCAPDKFVGTGSLEGHDDNFYYVCGHRKEAFIKDKSKKK